MKKLISKTIKVCDMCGKEVDDFANAHYVTWFFRPTEPAGVKISGSGFGPGPGNDDVCQECFEKAVIQFANLLEERSTK